MFKNYFKTGLRNFLNHKGYTFINVFSLTIGITCSILILLWITDELSYNECHEKKDRIYRVIIDFGHRFHSGSPLGLADYLKSQLPEVEEAVHFSAFSTVSDFEVDDKIHKKNYVYFAKPDVFNVFTFKWLRGGPENSINEPGNIVLSESLAKKLFGNEDPVGRRISAIDNYHFRDLNVTGVVKDMPRNSTTGFDALMSYKHNGNYYEKELKRWNMCNYETFLLLSPTYSIKELESKLKKLSRNEISKLNANIKGLHLQPFTKIYLDLNPINQFPTYKDNSYVYIFSAIGILILILSCVNFVNLSTARSFVREKEVGMRKIIGALKTQIVKQYTGESVLISLSAFLISVPLVELLLPVFNDFSGKKIDFIYSGNVLFFVFLIFFSMLVGVLAGAYPAFFISSFQPLNIIKGNSQNNGGSRRGYLRKILVITQLVISIVFINSALIIRFQIQYIRNKNLGYNKDHLVILPNYNKDMRGKFDVFRTELLKNRSIANITQTSYLPSKRNYYQNVWWEGLEEGNIDNKMASISVDENFIRTFQIEFVDGRNFSRIGNSDFTREYIINETAVRKMGFKNPIGKLMETGIKGQIIGVIKDFHYNSLRSEILPFALWMYGDGYSHLVARVSPDDIRESIEVLRKTWEKVYPLEPFDFKFMDDDFDRLYRNEIKTGRLFNLISLLAVLITALGLIGLTSFITDRRMSEIAIRKILGAPVRRIVFSLSKELIILVVIANTIAIPLVIHIMEEWLSSFAYRINMNAGIFILGALFSLFTTLLSVQYQSLKASTINPAQCLKSE